MENSLRLCFCFASVEHFLKIVDWQIFISNNFFINFDVWCRKKYLLPNNHKIIFMSDGARVQWKLFYRVVIFMSSFLIHELPLFFQMLTVYEIDCRFSYLLFMQPSSAVIGSNFDGSWVEITWQICFYSCLYKSCVLQSGTFHLKFVYG